MAKSVNAGKLLASKLFPQKDAQKIVDGDDRLLRTRLLAGVRAESEERFVETVGKVLELVDWKRFPKLATPSPELGLLGMGSWGPLETACDYLSVGDLLALGKLCSEPDAELGLAIFRAIELDDRAALSTIHGRLDPTRSNDHSPESEPTIGRVRYARAIAPIVGSTVEDRLRVAAKTARRGYLPAAIAAEAADARRIELPYTPVGTTASVSRFVLHVATAIDRDVAEDAIVAIAGESGMHDQRFTTFASVPWDEAKEVRSKTQLFLAGRLGRTVWTASTPLEPSGVPVPWKNVRIGAKRLADEAKAKLQLAKVLAEQAKKLGASAGPREPAAGIKNKDAELLAIATVDGSLERTIELLAGGAHPTKLRNKSERTALDEAVRMSFCEIVHRMLAAGGDPADTLHFAICDTSAYSVEVIRELVAAGAKARPGALAFAPEYYFQPSKIPLLVKAGAKPGANVNGKTPLEHAIALRFPRSAAALEALG